MRRQERKRSGAFWVAVSVCAWAIMIVSGVSGERVHFQKQDDGWRLQVSGKPYFVKGVTWSNTPIGLKYDYDLYKQPDAIIKATMKRDFTLMKAMGVNTLRGQAPVKWVEYAYKTYGMRTFVNEFCGRYGMTMDGKWIAKVNYSDPKTRTALIERWKDIARTYKDTEGVLMYALGNENNYGLEWKGAEIENLPEGERHKAKAKYLYSLFNEIATAVKQIDPNHPVGIVNGDLQYLSLIAELCPNIDYLGANVYRGRGFGPLFTDIKEKLNKPFLFAELGCDAYNAKTQQEDQDSQADFYLGQWTAIYQNVAGNGGAGNCVGALLFEWADEWWKKGQQVNLELHDTEGSWAHGAFYDADGDLKNMNEEWFGICSIHRTQVDGVHMISPRVAYSVMQKIWSVVPYGMGAEGVKSHLAPILSGRQLEEKAIKKLATAKKVKLPAVIYDDEFAELWAASGYMGNTAAVEMDPKCTTTPKDGGACLKVVYNASDNWAGVVWQDPPNDWGGQPGGYDLSAARRLVFWARGENGGEKIKVEAGILDSKAKYHDSAKLSLGELVLTSEWKEYSVPLAGKDMSHIKTGFCWVVAGQGKPMTFYFDQIRYE